jgi:hypothetical protein
MKIVSHAPRRAALLCGVAFAIAASQAHAGMTDVSLFRTGEYTQTGATTVVPANGGANYYFAANTDVSSDSDYDVNGAQLSVPTGTSYTMTGPSGVSPFIEYSTSSPFLTKSELDSEFPSGDYVFSASNSGTGASAAATLTYDGTDFYPNTPTYTAATFNGLASLNATEGYTFAFAPFVPEITGDIGLFLTITDTTTDTVVYSNESGDDTTTEFSVGAGTFTAGDSYIADLDFNNRDEITSPPCVGSDPSQCPSIGEVGWDSRTDVSFTVGAGAVPEPSEWVMLMLGFAGLGFVGYCAKQAPRAA